MQILLSAYCIGKSASYNASYSIIPNKHIALDLRLLLIQRNTQVSNNHNYM